MTTDVRDVLKRMLVWSYRDRISMRHVSQHMVFDGVRGEEEEGEGTRRRNRGGGGGGGRGRGITTMIEWRRER